MANKSYNNLKATKKSKTAPNIIDSISQVTNKKSVKKATKKQAKSLGSFGVISIIVALIIGIVGGYFATTMILKDDVYSMNTYEEDKVDITIGKDEPITTYQELGCKCVSFGVDISSQVKITYKYREDLSKDCTIVTSIDENKSGMYYVVYTIDNIKYKSVILIRNVIVLGVEVDE